MLKKEILPVIEGQEIRLVIDRVDQLPSGEEVIIDCFSRLHLCQAACCTFRVYLTTQDLDEAIVKWEYANPYFVRLRDGKYCLHCDPDSLSCQIHQHRPYTCRTFDCRGGLPCTNLFLRR